MNAILQVLEKLLARTNEGRIPWKTTVDEKSFTASFGATSVVIEELIPFGRYAFRILDEAGREIESANTSNLESNTDMFQDLFYEARRLARDTDNKLEALLAELDQV
jgi:hypothetical protein